MTTTRRTFLGLMGAVASALGASVKDTKRALAVQKQKESHAAKPDFESAFSKRSTAHSFPVNGDRLRRTRLAMSKRSRRRNRGISKGGHRRAA